MTAGRETFVALSVELTGFRAVDLAGTGQVDAYLGTLAAIVGDGVVGQLLGVAAKILQDGDDVHDRINERILADPWLGPVARNVIVMWYLGQWDQLPQAWRAAYGANPLDESRVLSAAAYREGLVWPAIGAHPMGAKPTGYGSWAQPPPDLATDA